MALWLPEDDQVLCAIVEAYPRLSWAERAAKFNKSPFVTSKRRTANALSNRFRVLTAPGELTWTC